MRDYLIPFVIAIEGALPTVWYRSVMRSSTAAALLACAVVASSSFLRACVPGFRQIERKSRSPAAEEQRRKGQEDRKFLQEKAAAGAQGGASGEYGAGSGVHIKLQPGFVDLSDARVGRRDKTEAVR